jgi:uncharacterized protein (DUF433 family)
MTLPDFLGQDRYGFIHITGHRIGLRHVVELFNDGYTAAMLLDHFPTLSLAQIYQVLAFYMDNKAEVDTYIQRGRQEMDRLAAVPQPGPSAAELRQRMETRRSKESA